MLDDEAFFEKACEIIKTDGSDLGPYIEGAAKDFDFSDEVLFRAQCLIQHIGGAEVISP